MRSIYVSLSVIIFRPVLPSVFVCPLFLVVPMSAHYDFTFANLVPFRVCSKYHTDVVIIGKIISAAFPF